MSPDDSLEHSSHWEPPSAEEMAGQVPGYDVERLIARGGMAAVYLARQISLDRPVALKVLPPELGQVPGFNERFASEARMLAKLHHSAIVAVIDFGHTAAGSAYIVMEMVDGLPLERWAVGRTFAEKIAVAVWLIQGVESFHEQGVVHADLKPDNIFVTEAGAVKILDFGLATPVVGGGAVQAPRFGTPPYTAPEAYSEGAKADPRSDTYSLGITLIQFFGSGKLPDFPTAETSEVARFLGRRDLAAVLEPMVRPQAADRPTGMGETVAALRALALPSSPTRPPVAAPRPAMGVGPARPAGPAAARRRIERKSKPAGPPWFKLAASLVLVVVGVGMVRHCKQRQSAGFSMSPASLAISSASDASAHAGLPSRPALADSPNLQASITATNLADEIFRAPAVVNPPLAPVADRIEGTRDRTHPAEDVAAVRSSQDQPPAPAATHPDLTPLQEKFLTALSREKEKASAAGDTALAEELTEESHRFTREKDVPETDPREVHPGLARLRAIFREEQAVKLPSDPKAHMTVWWQCDDRAELLLNGEPIAATAAKVFKPGGDAATIWQAGVAFAEGDVLGFKLRNTQGARHFVAVAKAGVRLLFVSDHKWEIMDGDPSAEWWAGKDKTGTPVQRLATRDYNERWVREFCAFTNVPSGSLTVCWGPNPARSHIRRPLTAFDFRTALGSAAR